MTKTSNTKPKVAVKEKLRAKAKPKVTKSGKKTETKKEIKVRPKNKITEGMKQALEFTQGDMPVGAAVTFTSHFGFAFGPCILFPQGRYRVERLPDPSAEG